jgi:hypothetical protein
MKKFYNLDEALHYQPSCPLCGDSIEADYKEVSMDPDSRVTKVTATFLTSSASEVSIDYYHNNIVSYKEKSSYNSSYVTGTNTTPHFSAKGSGFNKNGFEIFGVSASCTKCSMYSYVLQIHLDFKDWMAKYIFLNSESISIEEGETLHEIRNVYGTEKTEYDRFTKVEVDDGTVKMSGYSGRRNSTITFPLMPLDPKNPKALLNRIKTLIPFS